MTLASLVCVASRFDDPKLVESECFLDDLQKGLALFADRVTSVILGRIHAVTADLINDFARPIPADGAQIHFQVCVQVTMEVNGDG